MTRLYERLAILGFEDTEAMRDMDPALPSLSEQIIPNFRGTLLTRVANIKELSSLLQTNNKQEGK